MLDWITAFGHLAPVVAAIATLITVIRTNRNVGKVHTLVNSQKTLLEEQLASAVAEIRLLKAELKNRGR